jgi:signal transduction histidine kinase
MIMAAVFEQFKQVGGDTLTDKPKGTGLGLPICKEIVETSWLAASG